MDRPQHSSVKRTVGGPSDVASASRRKVAIEWVRRLTESCHSFFGASETDLEHGIAVRCIATDGVPCPCSGESAIFSIMQTQLCSDVSPDAPVVSELSQPPTMFLSGGY